MADGEVEGWEREGEREGEGEGEEGGKDRRGSGRPRLRSYPSSDFIGSSGRRDRDVCDPVAVVVRFFRWALWAAVSHSGKWVRLKRVVFGLDIYANYIAIMLSVFLLLGGDKFT